MVLGVGFAILLLLALDLASLILLAWFGAWWWPLAAVLGGLLAGALVLRYVGPVTAVRVAGRMRQGELPGRELVDALLMVVGGVLFLIPGLATDAVGLVLVVPGLRTLPRRAVVGWVKRRAVVVHRGAGLDPGAPAGYPRHGGEPGDGGTMDADFERR